jgi:hypothetical protein
MVLSMLVAVSACGGINKMGKTGPGHRAAVDVSRLKRLTVIANGSGRSEMQVTSRARERLTKAGVTLVRRSGNWESDTHA